MSEFLGSRLAIVKSARQFANGLKQIQNEPLKGSRNAQEYQRLEHAVQALKLFLDVLDEETGRDGLRRPFTPLLKAMKDLRRTGQTPALFKAMSPNRPIDDTDTRHQKIVCAMAVVLYRLRGIPPTKANARALKVLVKTAPKTFKAPKPRTIYEWYRKTYPGREYAAEFESLYNSLLKRTPSIFRHEPAQIDEWLAGNLKPFFD